MKQLSANEINGDFIHHLVVQDMNLMREKPQDSQRSRFMRIRAMEKRFSWDSSAEQYEAIYDEAANRKRIPQS